MKNMVKNEIVLHDPYSNALCPPCQTGIVQIDGLTFQGDFPNLEHDGVKRCVCVQCGLKERVAGSGLI